MRTLLYSLLIFLASSISFSETVEVSKPWNGYWWPISQGALVTGDGYRTKPSPIIKYDLSFSKLNMAVNWELENKYNPHADSWNGYCNGWAAASVLEEEPLNVVNYEGITYYVGDLKGLLTAYCQAYVGPVYGSRYNNENDDYSDINPLSFLTALELYLKENNIPILADLDAGIQIWTYPIYKYTIDWTDDGQIRHYTLQIFYSTDFVDPDTLSSIYLTKTYTFDTDLDNQNNPIYGVNTQWTNDSVDDHPDFLWYPESLSSNPYLKNPYLDLNEIHLLIDSEYNTLTDDSNESDNNFETSNPLLNSFTGRILDNDYFNFFLEPFESYDISIYFNDFHSLIFANLYDSNTDLISEFTYTSQSRKSSYTFDLTTDFSEYYLELLYPIIGLYKDNYFFEITKISQSIALSHTVPQGYWKSFSLIGFFPAEDQDLISDTVSYSIVGINNSLPVSDNTLIETIHSNSFSYLNSEISDNFEWVKFNSSENGFFAYNFYLSGDDGCMSYLKTDNPATSLILSHVPNNANYWWYGIVLLNPDKFTQPTVEYTLYSVDNVPYLSGTFSLNPYEKRVGLLNDIFPEADQSNTAYIYLKSSSPIIASSLYGTYNMDQMSYVPSQTDSFSSGETFIVPVNMLSEPDNWTGLALVNNSSNEGNLNVKVVYNDSSNVLKTISISSHERIVGLVEELIPDITDLNNVMRLEITPEDVEITGFLMTGNQNIKTLASFPFVKNYNEFKFTFPNLYSSDLSSHLVLYNQQFLEREVLLTFYDDSGNIIDSFYIDAPEFSKTIFDLHDYFNNETIENINNYTVQSDKFIISYLVISDSESKYFEIIPPHDL